MAGAAAAQVRGIRHYRSRSPLRRLGRGLALAVASVVFLGYVLAPIAWLVSSSFQSEREIISKPPHWIPQPPTLSNFSAIFTARDRTVTYESRKAADPSSGGFIPSTASNPTFTNRSERGRQRDSSRHNTCVHLLRFNKSRCAQESQGFLLL